MVPLVNHSGAHFKQQEHEMILLQFCWFLNSDSEANQIVISMKLWTPVVVLQLSLQTWIANTAVVHIQLVSRGLFSQLY